jgi:hypothetical protein
MSTLHPLDALHLQRTRIRQLVNNIRVYGYTPCRKSELAVAWVRYSELKNVSKKSLNRSKNLLSTGYNIQ